MGWISSTSFLDPDTEWDNEPNAYDGNTDTYTEENIGSGPQWGSWLDLILSEPIFCDKIRFNVYKDSGAGIDECQVELYYNDAWNALYWGNTHDSHSWYEVEIGSTKYVTKARLKFFNDHGLASKIAKIYEFEFNQTSTPSSVEFFVGGEAASGPESLLKCAYYESTHTVLYEEGVAVLGAADCSVVVKDKDGNIFAVSNESPGLYRHRVAKYKPDLTLDTTWGGDGYVETTAGVTLIIYDLVVASTGEVFIAVVNHVRKYNSTGSLIWDKDYSSQIGTHIRSMAIASDDSLVLGCMAYHNSIRISSDGTVLLTYPTGDNVATVRDISIGTIGGNEKVCIAESRYSYPIGSIFQFPVASTTRDWCVNSFTGMGVAKSIYLHSNEYIYATGDENILDSGYDLIKIDPADGSIVAGSNNLATTGRSVRELPTDRVVVGAEMFGTGNNIYVFDEDCNLLLADPIPVGITQRDILAVAGSEGIAPVISDQSGNKTVVVGQLVDLFVTASGSPTPTYQWYKDSSPMSGETSSTLSFYASLSDAGTYKCKVSNIMGDVWSNNMIVTVNSNKYNWNLFGINIDLGRLS